jgi:DNA helicase-2/ATP-dependent DNA helicase PcrA
MESSTIPVELRQAIDSDVKVLRVLGAAGTGKSLVIEQRALRFLRAGCSPQDIQVITANRMAAQSLRVRLAASGVKSATEVRVNTIRDVCRSLLAVPEAIEATGRFPRLMNSVEELFLLEDIKGRVPGVKPASLREKLENLYRGWAGLSADTRADTRVDGNTDGGTDTRADFAADERDLQSLIESELIARQAMLAAELSAVTWRYLNSAGSESDDLRATHLLVDDFQDFSRASQAVCGLLFSESLTVTGNPCQTQLLSDPYPCSQGLRDFAVVSVLPPASETIVLKTSLRCPQRIAAAGNALVLSLLEQEDAGVGWSEASALSADRSEASALPVASAASPVSSPNFSAALSATHAAAADAPQRAFEPLAVFDESTPLGCVAAVKWTDPVRECEEITSWLKRRSADEKNPLELGSVLIIVPNRVWGRQFSKRLDALRLPHEDRYAPNSVRGNPLRLDASAGMRSLTLLTLAAYPDDATAWRSWCGFGHRQANSAAWERLMDWAHEQGLATSEALRHLAREKDSGKVSPFEGSDLLVQAWQRATAILKRCQGKKGERLLGLLCDGDDPSLDDFEALVRPLDGAETALELYERARDQLLDPVFTYERRLRIATFQTAAALEAKLVIITGMVEGLVPTVSSRDIDQGGVADEGAEASARVSANAQTSANAQKRHRERCALYDTLSRATSELVFSYFQKADVRTAEKLGMEIRRLRPERGGDRALLAPSSFLDEMGHAVPGIVARLPE